jgi:WD40 repeat protein
MRYRGHRSMQTIKDVSFVGPSDCAVASGSDDGRMFIWNRRTGVSASQMQRSNVPPLGHMLLTVTV